MHDMGGMSFFAVTMEQCKGDWELLQCAMDGANKEVDECTHTLPCHHAPTMPCAGAVSTRCQLISPRMYAKPLASCAHTSSS